VKINLLKYNHILSLSFSFYNAIIINPKEGDLNRRSQLKYSVISYVYNYDEGIDYLTGNVSLFKYQSAIIGVYSTTLIYNHRYIQLEGQEKKSITKL